MKDCALKEELVYATKWSSWEKICRRSHTSHEAMDTRHTTEVKITESNSCYAGVTSPKTKQILKSQNHLQALERRMKLWDEGNIEGLLYEGMSIQQRLRSDKEGMTIAKISLKLKNLMSKGNVNGALKLLTDNMYSGILPLNKDTLELLIQKHPEPREP